MTHIFKIETDSILSTLVEILIGRSFNAKLSDSRNGDATSTITIGPESYFEVTIDRDTDLTKKVQLKFKATGRSNKTTCAERLETLQELANKFNNYVDFEFIV
jgi:hypothetical protein